MKKLTRRCYLALPRILHYQETSQEWWTATAVLSIISYSSLVSMAEHGLLEMREEVRRNWGKTYFFTVTDAGRKWLTDNGKYGSTKGRDQYRGTGKGPTIVGGA